MKFSQDTLNENGVQTKLTQQDLIEVLTAEQLDSINEQVNDINLLADGLLVERGQIHAKQMKAIGNLAVNKITKMGIEFTEDELNNCVIKRAVDDSADKAVVYVLKLQVSGDSKNAALKKLSQPAAPVKDTKKFTGTYLVTFKHEVTGEDYVKTELHQVKVQVNIVNDLTEWKAKVDALNARSEVLLARYKGVNLSFEAIAKQTKISVNKQLIIQGSPELKETLRTVFGLSLK